MKRSGKFYRKNEAEVMKSLGFKPTPGSGAGWLHKEDGENECAICQLKSTDAESIRIQQKDLHTLEYNAAISHKTPVFAVQFLQSNEVWLMVKPEDLGALQAISEGDKVCKHYLDLLPHSAYNLHDEVDDEQEIIDRYANKVVAKRAISSSLKARERFKKEVEETYKKKGKSAT